MSLRQFEVDNVPGLINAESGSNGRSADQTQNFISGISFDDPFASGGILTANNSNLDTVIQKIDTAPINKSIPQVIQTSQVFNMQSLINWAKLHPTYSLGIAAVIAYLVFKK